jgi:catalase
LKWKKQLLTNVSCFFFHGFQRDGFMTVSNNGGSKPNYPSPLRPYTYKGVDMNQQHETWVGQAVKNLQIVGEEDYVQADMLWEVLGRQEGEQDQYVYPTTF